MNTNQVTTDLMSTTAGQPFSTDITALLILLAGLCAAVVLRLIASRMLEAIGFNTLCDKLGVSEFLRKGDVRYAPAKLMALLAFWVVLLGTILRVLHLIGVRLVVTIIERLQAALPAYILALSIAVLGCTLISFLANVLRTFGRNAAIPYADLLSRAIKWLGICIVLVMAVEQLGIEFKLVSAIFLIVVGAAAFGLALAFGLGCKDIARDTAQRFLQHLRERHRQTDTDLEG